MWNNDVYFAAYHYSNQIPFRTVMKKHLAICALLLFALTVNAQWTDLIKMASDIKIKRKKPKSERMDYDQINKAMQMTEIIIDGQPFSYLKLYDSSLYRIYTSYPSFSAERKDQYDSLSYSIGFVAGMLESYKDAFTFHSDGESYLTELKTGISNLRNYYSLLDISGYESVYSFCVSAKYRHRQVADSINAAHEKIATKTAEQDNSAPQTSHKSIEAYLHERDSIWDAKQRHDDSVELAREKKERAEYDRECIKRFGPKNGSIIAKGQIRLGFTDEMVEYAWGSTDYTTYTTYTQSGTLEKRVYKTGKILTFKKGILISITE
jgi:hypothetical protein